MNSWPCAWKACRYTNSRSTIPFLMPPASVFCCISGTIIGTGGKNFKWPIFACGERRPDLVQYTEMRNWDLEAEWWGGLCGLALQLPSLLCAVEWWLSDFPDSECIRFHPHTEHLLAFPSHFLIFYVISSPKSPFCPKKNSLFTLMLLPCLLSTRYNHSVLFFH